MSAQADDLPRLLSALSSARNATIASPNRACLSTKLPLTEKASSPHTLKLNRDELMAFASMLVILQYVLLEIRLQFSTIRRYITVHC